MISIFLISVVFAFPLVASSFTIQNALTPMIIAQQARTSSTTTSNSTNQQQQQITRRHTILPHHTTTTRRTFTIPYLRMSSSSSSSRPSSRTTEDNSSRDETSFSGKTLLSVQECIEAYRCNKSNSESKSVFVDASWWHTQTEPNTGRTLFEQGPRIPESKHFDMDDICLTPDLNPNDLPHMIPTMKLFAAAMDHYGIKNDHHIIITARDSVYFTPRIWFLFKAFGHDPDKLHLMQGSLEEWISAGGEVDTKPTGVPVFQQMEPVHETKYKVLKEPSNVCDMKHVMGALERNDRRGIDGNGNANGYGNTLILDSRGSSFASKGHMPGAIHLPYGNWVEKDNTQKWKSIKELSNIFKEAGVDPATDQDIICTCGSGVSVCHTLLALELCGRDLQDARSTLMYDGSWAEYGKETDTPKVI